MAEDGFQFKRFFVRHSSSGLKVGTDGVLLGVLASLPQQQEGASVLDIGTGTGLVALILAQRMESRGAGNFRITGIDIDADAADEAAFNFEASPWREQLQAQNISLQDMASARNGAQGFGGEWKLIASNPPFFENSLKAPDAQRSMARHTDTLSYRDIIAYSKEHLADDGVLAMILPSSEENAVVRYAASFGLYPLRITYIKTTAAKAPKRMVIQLHKDRTPAIREEAVMMENGAYTADFKELTGEFYL